MTELLALDPDVSDVFLRGEALAAGYSESAIVALTTSGDWVRLRRGAYTSRFTWEAADRRQRHALLARAVLKQAKTDLVLSHTTAAVAAFGAPEWGVDLGVVHATRPDRHAGRVEAGVHQHQGLLLPGDVVTQGSWDVTSPTKTALDVTTMLALEVALGIVNHLLHHDVTDAASLEARYASMERDPHTLRTDLVLRLADRKIESLGESRTFFWCWKGGLPRPELQHPVEDAGIEVAYLDFAWPKLGKWIEFDGLEKYLKLRKPGQSIQDAVLAEKRREDLIRRLTQWMCLRIVWADLENPRRLVALIRDFLEAR